MKHLEDFFRLRFLSLKGFCAVLVLAVVFSTLSCSKDDDEPVSNPISYQEENPLDKYHEMAGFTATTNFINSGNYEFGLVFSPNVKGKIKAVTIKLPDANPNVRITIWDYSTKTVVRSEMIDVSAANTLITKTIQELAVEKDKKYMITMNSNDWYKRSKPDNSNAVYPVTAGNIRFWEYRWGNGTTQTFPVNVSLDYNGGDLSFVFQQTD
ncbi:DUF4082 domain-containing protein [Chryseobacterium sp. NRRL B-14859]|uniref:DUF4082 domain-containing protein n=1 Tax=unclassified Chryseobacterium TaxID=2593645 RepID=UPI000F45E768|nr:DUF4082 domain-containing protein [Chryseobacterium sp. G0240]ROI05137.1 DUF4082 domain-containing protein [Chryseobacterium sp. G0240]